ncbi:WD repeat-containing protein 75 [Octopus sinensis]|uniref:WD repeat-containing protein 75 n=1 Tax=Octopus sinensis TaxID=2607531 RepID=A0A6P7TJF8_9MOLL|nr:WD repeat-containing protein 75 [Octopus sinensis]
MSIVSVGSGYLVGYRPICSYDSRWLICASNTVVVVYSLKTGECVHKLRGHTKTITGVVVHPMNKLQILSCSLDETIIQWDYNDGVLLKKYHLNVPVQAMLPFPSSNTTDVILLMEDQSKSFNLCSYKLSPDEDAPPDPTVLLSKCSGDERCAAVGYHGRFVAAVTKLKLFIKDLQSNQSMTFDCQNEGRFTCVSCHPNEQCLATGSSDGRIIIWRRFLGSSKVIKTTNHWHALPVMDLRFSAEGTRLFSGGHECTLVTWHLLQQTRDFLPRLGAPIKAISVSPDNRLTVLCLSDNEILVIDNSSSSIVQAITGITVRELGYQLANPYPVGLLYDPNKKALVSNGKPGHLQFYCMHTNKPLFNLDVVGVNYISPENLEKQAGVVDVVKAGFSDDGEWLATLQHWEISGFDPEIHLKFWHYNSKKQKYILNTIITSPHLKHVNSLCFSRLSPTVGQPGGAAGQSVVTCSEDGMFKLWGLPPRDPSLSVKETKWSCELEGFYRDYIPKDASFTEDASLLGVTFNHLITIWDPLTKSLQRVLQNPLDQSNCRQLKFGRKSCFHLLVTTSESRLTVWNILTSTVLWSVNVSVSCLTVDPDTEIMAAFTEDKCLYVFIPSESHPVYQEKDITEEPVVYATFITHLSPTTDLPPSLQWQKNSQLYFMNSNQELLTIIEKDDKFNGLKRPGSMTIPENLPENEFGLIIGKRRKLEKQPEPMETSANQPSYSSPLLRELINIPAAVCPPVASFTGRFIQSLLAPRDS